MEKLFDWIINLPWNVAILLCLTLGLAPFTPPHLWEKLQMLFRGTLIRPLDWFDLFLHATPWIILLIKVFLEWTRRSV
ncbi:RND transporter [Deltaproteobacteria bacterium TL4]